MTDLCARTCEMFRKIIISTVALWLSFSALAQSERLHLDTDFKFDFDNTEYTGSGLGTSETLFGVSLAPSLRYVWGEKHHLSVGVSAQKWFGSDRFLDDIDLLASYQFDNGRYSAIAGIFLFDKLKGRYSEAFFSNIWLANNNTVQGLALQYTDKVGLVELAIDWCGLYSAATREQFRILLSGEGRFAKVGYAGATASMQHYANRSTFQGNVVDNLTINPYIGVNFNAFFDFDIRLGYLQSLQRDRLVGGGLVGSYGWRAILPNKSLGSLYLEQPLCWQKSTTSLPLRWQGGNNIWCGFIRCRPILWYNKWHLQPYGHRLRAQLLEGAHQGQGRDGPQDRRKEALQPADCVARHKSQPEIV